jgi:HSP20 family protein
MRTPLQPFAVGELDRVFGALTGWDDVAGSPFLHRTPRRAQERDPRLTHWQQDDVIWLRAEVPGLRLDDLELTLHGPTLHLKARRHVEHDEAAESMRLERGSWSMTRNLELPFRADPGKVEATLADGVLTVKLVAEPAPAPHTIAVVQG